MAEWRASLDEAWETGFLAAVCGIDGSGKSTVLEVLETRLIEAGYHTLVTKQPTDFYRQQPIQLAYQTVAGAPIPPESIALLSACDRLWHVANECAPAMKMGAVVLTHRYVYATYAIFSARGVDSDWVEAINRYCPPAHFAVLLDCPGAVASGRIERRGGPNRLDEASVQMLEKIRQEYLRFFPADGLRIDATQPIERTTDMVWSALKRALDERAHPRRSR